MSRLAAAVDHVFGDEFLFETNNQSWLATVVDPSTGKAKDVDPSLILSFPKIALECASADGAKMLIELGKLVQSGATTNVVLSPGADDAMFFRRKTPLDFALHPDKRTVFVKPIHYGASEQIISDFFSAFGTVERVERRQYAEGSHLKVRPSVFVVFKTQQDALKCVNAKPTYGKLPTDLGNMFVPALTVLMKGAQDTIDEMERGGAPAANASSSSATAVESTKFLQKGCSLQIKSFQSSTSWRDVKMKLGNLAINQPGLKNKITLVFADATKGRCFVFMKDASSAQALVLCYLNAISSKNDDAHFVEGLKEVVPSLEVVSDEKDEKWLQEQYAKFSNAKVVAKQEKNKKRLREE